MGQFLCPIVEWSVQKSSPVKQSKNSSKEGLKRGKEEEGASETQDMDRGASSGDSWVMHLGESQCPLGLSLSTLEYTSFSP